MDKKRPMSSFKAKFAASFTTIFAMSCFAHSLVFANPTSTEITPNPTNALKNAGITAKTLNGSSNSLFKDLQNVVNLIMALGGFWGIAWLVLGGMLLSGSGSNPQKRSAGIGAICMAALGIFVIYKAYDIAGWAVNLGS